MDFLSRNKEQAGVVAPDPQPVLTVCEQAPHACDAFDGIQGFKGVPVVTDQPRVASDPDEAVVCLHDRVRLGGRQAVPVVVQNRGIPFAVSEGIDGRLGVQIAGRVYRPRPGLTGRGAERHRCREHGKQQTEHPSRPAVSPLSVQSSSHAFSSFGFRKTRSAVRPFFRSRDEPGAVLRPPVRIPVRLPASRGRNS